MPVSGSKLGVLFKGEIFEMRYNDVIYQAECALLGGILLPGNSLQGNTEGIRMDMNLFYSFMLSQKMNFTVSVMSFGYNPIQLCFTQRIF